MGLLKDLMQQYQFNSTPPETESFTIDDAVVELQDRVRNLEALVSDLIRELDGDDGIEDTKTPLPPQTPRETK